MLSTINIQIASVQRGKFSPLGSTVLQVNECFRQENITI